jgi:hypothetical protein
MTLRNIVQKLSSCLTPEDLMPRFAMAAFTNQATSAEGAWQEPTTQLGGCMAPMQLENYAKSWMLPRH